MRVKGKDFFRYILKKEDLERIAKDMIGKPFVVYSLGDFKGERKVIGKVLEAHVVEDHIEYEADISELPKESDYYQIKHNPSLFKAIDSK